MNVSDGVIRKQRKAMLLQWQAQGIDTGKVSRRQFKQVMGAMIQVTAERLGKYYDLSKGWCRTKMSAPQVKDLYHAVAQDRAKRVMGVFDKDIVDLKDDSWRRQIRRYRECWEQLIPELPGPKCG